MQLKKSVVRRTYTIESLSLTSKADCTVLYYPTNTGGLSDTSEVSPKYSEVKIVEMVPTSAFYLTVRVKDRYLDATSPNTSSILVGM